MNFPYNNIEYMLIQNTDTVAQVLHMLETNFFIFVQSNDSNIVLSFSSASWTHRCHNFQYFWTGH
jgi:hypothetical protein